jgi:hypothetical protein
MDELRARAYLDLLLGMDSRPAQPCGDDGPGAAGRCGESGRADDQDDTGPERDSADDSGTGGPDVGDFGTGGPGADSDSADGHGPDAGGPDDGGPDRGGLDGGGPDGGGQDGGGPGPGEPGRPAGPAAGAIPPGFVGRLNLTVPLATMLGLAGRPGEAAGIGPVDPDPEANTLDRYQTGASADPGIQRISVPDRAPQGW